LDNSPKTCDRALDEDPHAGLHCNPSAALAGGRRSRPAENRVRPIRERMRAPARTGANTTHGKSPVLETTRAVRLGGRERRRGRLVGVHGPAIVVRDGLRSARSQKRPAEMSRRTRPRAIALGEHVTTRGM
jgi:hypothetical protein